MDALMIGVSGMRGVVGTTLTPDVVARMAAAYAVFLTQRLGRAAKVVVGRDGRPSGQLVQCAAVAELIAAGHHVVDLGVLTTPGCSLMIEQLQADAAMIVTASHNPVQWNGLKFYNAAQAALPPEDAAALKQLYEQAVNQRVTIERIVPPEVNSSGNAWHVKRVMDRLDANGISGKRFKVVLDSVNGAGCVSASTLLGKLGCQVKHLNGEATGRFAHEPEPIEKNLTQLCEEVRRQKASVGFAQDPDADRLAIVDEQGTYIGEEYSLALFARFVLGKKTAAGTASPCVAVTNLSTSRMLDDIAAMYGSTVIRTPVGEANVVAAMQKHDAAVGGEGNGGVIDLRIVPGRDSLVGMAYVLQLLAETGKTVSQLVAEIPKYAIVKSKFECRREDAERAVEAVAKAMDGQGKVDRQDGIRIDWPEERAWVHARPSNTEPIMRIIAEAPQASLANQKTATVQAVVDHALGKA